PTPHAAKRDARREAAPPDSTEATPALPLEPADRKAAAAAPAAADLATLRLPDRRARKHRAQTAHPIRRLPKSTTRAQSLRTHAGETPSHDQERIRPGCPDRAGPTANPPARPGVRRAPSRQL